MPISLSLIRKSHLRVMSLRLFLQNLKIITKQPVKITPLNLSNNLKTDIKKKFLIQKQGNENVKAPKVKGKDVPESQDSQDTKEESAKNNEDRVLREVEQAKMQELEGI